ncbi:triple tyrosine motif-containing protein [Lutibacter sp.]|uniref:helix-turn-helix and ligand-binding sensor domain-containing protein n=1 Tax=Lutibacter sp. TaxID=1925666 RepID=UPI002735A5E1|nr:triple tyrosine motif-containing protein [Lutibacter sp.]MDP3313364.1 triple tyrosine motif-containing protein [Lutibacter sp.]
MKYIQNFLLIISLFISCNVKAQELPPIEKYSTEDYLGGNQNWMVSQAPDKIIYVANNEGLLEFNGARWKIYPSPNNTIIRAVNVVKDRIYTGCYMEFGYWQKDDFGMLKYNSLVPFLDVKMVEDEHIWNIITYNELVIFQSFDRIYFYNTIKNKFNTISSENQITKIFNINNVIYYYVLHEGLYTFKEGKSKLISNDLAFNKGIIINIFSLEDGLLIQTRNLGFYTFKNYIAKEWNIEVNKALVKMKVFNSIQLKDKSFVLGTISDGIIYLTKEGIIDYQINQTNGLSNNTALSLFEDQDENIWVGLDNGINCINIKSPVRIFNDDRGSLGTVYASTVFNKYIYLGTNQGLFYKKIDTEQSYKIIDGTAGQVWNLFVFNNELFCGHHLGTYIIEKNKAIKISNIPGTWEFKPIPNLKNGLLQGNYNGFNVLIKNDGKWSVRNKIDGFDNSVRFFEFLNATEIFVNHEYKGVFKLKVDENYTFFIKVSKQLEPPLGKHSSLIKFKNNILYGFDEGVYRYNSKINKFLKDSILSQIVTNETYLSGKLVVDEAQNLWGFTNENMSYVSINDLTNEFNIHTVSIPANLRKGILGYENISHLKNSEYLIGTTCGYIILNLAAFDQSNDYTVIMDNVIINNKNSTYITVNLKDEGEFKYKQNSITFNYSVPEYNKYQIVKYQYKLNGNVDKWSEWTEKTELIFDNLPFGNYNFKVRAKIGNKLSENIASYNFEILKPWYLSNLAVIAYLLSFLGILLIIHKSNKRYYKKQLWHKQLESEQLIIRMKNEKLNQDIENKNRELAISTMSIINKNEVLNTIKNELKGNDMESNNLQVLKLIDGNLNNSKDWDVFKEAFNNADKYFLDKIKELHPNLTPNDLRFCAYLRLNLTSKEISPLLNMTVRSVETKRYRLRKQMGLPHDSILVSYILNI